ncbi:MAG: hypothetical protein P5683_24705 [Limnospira sp. PMC 1279.21]|uniref:Uncharacterized protein n=1 Tax=Limnospira maxima CS-328 TaxID=513049 RepID=B5VZD0_LIMMA|nr:hypothetical protein [Limnospira sp. PMC 1242.20]EDZ95331.1 hypothetical protein AmaxDRAFT_1932 [Limnospira maxima CS-328]EKD08753.1 hypothetical protein SPLC1_S201540 [Arthrospira platensis C1]MDT9201237.1 hypothetical protein [Limnospira sp. PMC 1042.18]MDT9226771.1 hypothetical protein [Limnospira sp. PMC 1279.21]MDT9252301.1 hypothetical protein [Limnospira sp. PMC 1280.21]MDT9262489.1 hypothetical protein [Limnospira sp. PMC 1236.20]MDT9277773.1 hypothetical protein [Limnospira sp. P
MDLKAASLWGAVIGLLLGVAILLWLDVTEGQYVLAGLVFTVLGGLIMGLCVSLGILISQSVIANGMWFFWTLAGLADSFIPVLFNGFRWCLRPLFIIRLTILPTI